MLSKFPKYHNMFFAPDGDTVLGAQEDETDPGVPPLTRDDDFWALMAGDPNAVELTPKTKQEYYMSKIAERLAALAGGVALIPVPKKTDNGKVIKVNSDGEYALAADATE